MADHGVAASFPATAEALAREGRSSRRTGWAAIALGVVALIAFGIACAVFASQDADLRDTGVRTRGTVYELYPDQKGSTGKADVQFLVDGEPTFATVELGSAADGYERDQPVTVYYDPADPQRMTIDDVGYEPVGSATPLTIALVGGVGAIGLGIVSRRGARTRRSEVQQVLAGGPWRELHVRVLRTEGGTTFTTEAGEAWSSGGEWTTYDREPRKLAGWGLPDEDPADVPWGQDAWWVVDGERAVFSPDRGRPFVLARRSSIRPAQPAQVAPPAEVVAPVPRPTRRRVLGGWGVVGLVAFALADLTAFGLAWIGVGLAPRAPLGEVLNPTVPLGLLVVLFTMMGTCRIVGDPAGWIDVIGGLLVRRVPVDAVAGVSSGKGLQLVLRSGQTIGSMAYGESLLGDLVGYPRSVRTAERVRQFVRDCPGGGADAVPVTDLRAGELLLALLLVLGAVLINWV